MIEASRRLRTAFTISSSSISIVLAGGDDGYAGRARVVLRQLSFDEVGRPYQRDLDAVFAGGLYGALHGLEGRLVASHGVDCDSQVRLPPLATKISCSVLGPTGVRS